MTDKITSKELYPYLPYEVEFESVFQGKKFIDKLTLNYIIDLRVERIKPILRPLSDYKDINGDAMNELNTDISDQIIISDLACSQIGLHDVAYGVIQILAENHVDFQRLIEKGLAVDVNTLENA